jgi:predicted nucleic-acid-binding protein
MESQTIAEQYHNGLSEKCEIFVTALLEIVRFTGTQITQSASQRDKDSEQHQTVISKESINARLEPYGLKITSDLYLQGLKNSLKAI